MSKILQKGRSWVNEQGQLQKIYTIVECCGDELHCFDFTNTCPICGTDYNWNGDELAPRSQWGEETGEHPADIVNMREPLDDNY